MNLPKKNYYIDTSVLSPISFIDIGKQQTTTISNYEHFLDQMELYHPKFVDTDFTLVITSAPHLELIGLGKARVKLKKQVEAKDWERFISLDHEKATGDFFDMIACRIRFFVQTELLASKLYRHATVKFLRRYRTHAHSHFVAARIKRWAKNLRIPEHYRAFAKAIFLDTIFRYSFINLDVII